MKMKNRVFALAAAICIGLLLCLPAAALGNITDINGHWAQAQIEKWAQEGLIAGSPGGQIKPEEEITRVEFVKLVNRAFGKLKEDAACNFSDVKTSDSFFQDVASGVEAGYIAGYPDGSFKPHNKITRQEVAAILTRLLQLRTVDKQSIESLADYHSIAQWAKTSINSVMTHGLMGGFPDNTFRAQKSITRAETIATLERARVYAEERSLVIDGTVSISNQPVKEAKVRIFYKDSKTVLDEAVTGENGSFTFALPPGEYELTAVKDKYVGYTSCSSASGAIELEVSLTEGARVSGILSDNQGNRLANASIAFTTNPCFVGSTDNNGAFSIILPTRGNQGQVLFYNGIVFYNGLEHVFAANRLFIGDTNLGVLTASLFGRPSDDGGGSSGPGGGIPIDSTPPAWTQGYPKVANISENGFTLLSKINEDGLVYYVVLADGAASPSAAEVKDGTGSGGVPPINLGRVSLTANTETGVIISGLTAGTPYDIYVLAGDTAQNLQASPVKLEVTTSTSTIPGDTTAPVITGAVVNGSTLVLTYNENLDAASQPAGSDFGVKVNGSLQAPPASVTIAGSTVTVTLANGVNPGETVTVSYLPGTNPIRDAAGNPALQLTDYPVVNNTGALAAPPVDQTVATDLFTSTTFLYSGDSAVQTGMNPGTIVDYRAAVIRGRVLASDNTPLPDVQISILNHPEFGSTLSRADGYFDMAINGGGVYTVNYAKNGYLAAQRPINVPWQDFAVLPDVVLIPYDDNQTEVNLGEGSPMQVARGSVVTDKDGTRQATLLIPAGVTAHLEDGTPLHTLTVRATEYSVGATGQLAMPAPLPPNVGYTYCVEYSADEAGGQSVVFDNPIYHYLENFINAPVGGIVPMGYYDYKAAAWIPSKNGLVIKILSITNGMADLDVDGSGQPADAAALAALNITDEERQQLAALYQPGQELWRVPITHFTPWDCNWPYGPPLGATPPNVPNPRIVQERNPCKGSGSIIEYQSQVLGETSKIWGTSFTLNYRSSRVDDNYYVRSLYIPISNPDLHPDLKRIELEIEIAGKVYKEVFDPLPNQGYLFNWDGKDVYGRTIQGSTPINVKIHYIYPALYQSPAPLDISFAASSGSPQQWSSDMERLECIVTQEWSGKLSFWRNPPFSLGGWSIDVHHTFDPMNQVLYLGDGNSREVSRLCLTIVAGRGSAGYSGDNGPAVEAELYQPRGIAVGPDGSLYIADTSNHCIRKKDRSGVITTVVGHGFPKPPAGYSGDGGEAIYAQLRTPTDVALGPDGSLYIADNGNHCIRRVGPDGIITTVAGIGGMFSSGYSGDGGPATDAELYSPTSIDVGPDGSLYIADSSNHCIRKVDPAGIITTVAGKGPDDYGFSGDGGPARDALLTYPDGIALAPDGSLFFTDNGKYVRRIGTDGIITTVAGDVNSGAGYSGDGGPAIEAQLNDPTALAFGPDGSLYIVDSSNHCLRKVTPDGIITTVSGDGTGGLSDDGIPAGLGKLNYPCGVAVGPDGNIYIADTFNHLIRWVGQPAPSELGTDMIIPAEDGSELYVFDGSGRHKRTINAISGQDIYTFAYDGFGNLTQITDAFGNVTQIERDDQGKPTAIIAPGGQRTGLEVNENGYLSKIICPLYKERVLTYTNGGLLTSLRDHKGNVHTFTYDQGGRLIKDQDPAGGYTELSRTELSNGYEVRVDTAEGRTATYKVEYLSDGRIKRIDTDPFGGVTVTEINEDGTQKVTYPDGSEITMTLWPDPRPGLGIRAPYTRELRLKTPAGLTYVVNRNREIVLSNDTDIFSITQIRDTVTNNGVSSSSTVNIDRINQKISITEITPEGRETRTILDWYGRVETERTDNLETIYYSYNEKGYLSSIAQGDQLLTYTYDDMNRIQAIEDKAGNKFRYEYNGADLLTKLVMPGGQEYLLNYDANGNLTEITLPSGATHQLGYTVVDLPESYTPPANPSYQKSYNRDRAVIRLTLPTGRNVVYEYDSGGRITDIKYDTTETTFTYNSLTDILASIQRTPDQISYDLVYDGALLTRMTAKENGAVYGEYSYRYDDNLRVVGLTLNGEPEEVLEYDEDGLATKYGSFSINHGGPYGAPSQISDGIMNVTYNYDDLGRPQKRTYTVNGRQVYSLDLTYDNTGMIEKKDETLTAGVSEYSYTYDANKQLLEARKDGILVESYTYDVNGNRENGNAIYDVQDRLTELDGVVYQFDADGYLTQRGGDTFNYTAQGELRQASLAGGEEISYTYDGLGRRVGRVLTKEVDGIPVVVKELYLYGDVKDPYRVTGLQNNEGLSRYYYDENGFLLALKKGTVWYYVATDHQGTPRVVCDSTGQVIKVLEYDSFGKLLSDSNPSFYLPIGFAGGLADPDTRLVHFGLRDYDPAAGRWTARDPILFNGQQGNLYVYVSNNPVNLRDPYGLFCIGGSAYLGIGGGGQLCITGEGVSVCAEVGFGVGTSVEVSPFGELAETGSTIGLQGGISYFGVGPSFGLTLDNCGSLKFNAALNVGPFSKSASYDFLEKKWSSGDLSVGGDTADLNTSWLDSFKPKIGASAKLYGQKCLRF